MGTLGQTEEVQLDTQWPVDGVVTVGVCASLITPQALSSTMSVCLCHHCTALSK